MIEEFNKKMEKKPADNQKGEINRENAGGKNQKIIEENN